MSMDDKDRPKLPGEQEQHAEQIALFDKGQWHDEMMKGMPEFKQENLQPFHTIYVHFESHEDMEKFAKLVEQKIMLTTRSIWYPEATIEHWNKNWVDALPTENPEEGKEGIETIDEQ